MGRFLLINVGAAVLAWILASQKGRNAVGWALLCFVVPFLVIVLAFLPEVRKTAVILCTRCGRPMPGNANHCPACGQSRPIEMVECRHCHTIVPAGPVCGSCNRSL